GAMPRWAWAGGRGERPAAVQDAAAPPAASAPFRKSRRPSCSPCSISLAMSISGGLPQTGRVYVGAVSLGKAPSSQRSAEAGHHLAGEQLDAPARPRLL